MCDLDGEAPDVWLVTMPRARKPHRCDGCGGTIRSGTVYTQVKLLYDGSWSTGRACSPCAALSREFAEAHPLYGVPFPGALRKVVEECVLEREDGWERWQRALDAMRARRGQEEVSHDA